MSRRDQIIALAISSNKEKESCSVPVKIINPNPRNTTCSFTRREPIPTDIDKLWSRPLDFNDFHSIFYFKNEYSSSMSIVHEINTKTLQQFIKTPMLQISPPRTRPALLCYEMMPDEDEENLDPYDSDDSVKDKNYDPDTVKSKNKKRLKIFDTEVATCHTIIDQITVHADIHNALSTSTRSCNESTSPGILVLVSRPDNLQPTEEISVVNSPQMAIQDSEPADVSEKESTLTSVNDKGLTKLGLPSKRRKFSLPVSERLKIKKENDDEKLSLKPPCDDICRRKCTSKITNEERKKIHDRYINLNYESRGVYLVWP